VQILARLGIAAAALAAIVGSQAAAQTPEEFYRGKSIDFVIGYPPGGSNDTFGRLVARHLGKYIRDIRASFRRTPRAPAASWR